MKRITQRDKDISDLERWANLDDYEIKTLEMEAQRLKTRAAQYRDRANRLRQMAKRGKGKR